MRTLCLNLQKVDKPCVAENFLAFSPRVYFRDPGLVFLDITGTSHLFGGEEPLMNEAVKLSKDFYPDTQAAIADTPSTAQVFSSRYESFISRPTHAARDLESLPLAALNQLEGLIAWKSSHEIDEIVDFFSTLGIHQIGEIKRFQLESFRERWGHTGSLLWKRLNGLEKQVISPLLPSASIQDYVYLDFPVSLLSFLLHLVSKSPAVQLFPGKRQLRFQIL